MNRIAVWLVIVLSPVCFAADKLEPCLLAQNPTLSRTQIVFAYAGDLWSVPREGGDARRLTAGAGVEDNPVFSPDGSLIAFTGQYDGNTDVFVMPATGGVPKRLTWHPAEDFVLGWTPDGKRILFSSDRAAYAGFRELFTVDFEGRLPQKIDLPMGFEGAYSPDGAQLAYVPMERAFTTWKRYRGGMTTPIWIVTLATAEVAKVPRDNSNDFNPMWIGDKVYFLSDRNGPVTLFSYDVKTGQVRQLIENRGLDFKSAGAGPDAIVCAQFGSLHLYDLKSGKSKPVPVHLDADLAEVRPRFVKVGKDLRTPHISPTGARAVFEAHGEILTVPAEKGDARNITNSPGVMERDPAWSPDGKSIACFSDESGEYELHILPQDGMGDVKKIKLGEKPGFYFAPRWSPDGRKVAYVDNHLTIWYVDIELKKPVRIDKDVHYSYQSQVAFDAAYDGLTPVWSPDSAWVAYARRLRNHMYAIYVYSIADNKSTQVTDGMSDARYPAFDKDGRFLYFTASTDSGPSMQYDIQSPARPVSRSIYLIVLSKDEPSPLAPESDDEKGDKKPDHKKAEDTATTAKPAAVRIEFDNISQRILALPMPPRRYVSLQVGKAGVLYAVEQPSFYPNDPWEDQGPPKSVHRFDLKSRKSDIAVGGVGTFEISLNGEKMLYRQDDKWYIAPPTPMAAAASPPPTPPPASSAGVLKTDGLEIRVDPQAAWRQMYREVWRIERDFFYDPGYHGLDLEATARRYQPYLENVSSVYDLDYLFSEMLGELTASHLGAWGGDWRETKWIQPGLLGADYKLENARYRFARVYSGENWNPDLRAPLTQPGVNVVAGEYLLAVNGRDLRDTDNIYSFFDNTAGKSVMLRVGLDPSGASAREVIVRPAWGEFGLRNLAWIEDNRRKVDRMTNGRVAYIYMPNTWLRGYTNFNRYFFAQIGKEAAIVDERFNGGGLFTTDIIEYLRRPWLSSAATRDGEDEPFPDAIFGPKVMIINEFAGSGGDLLAWYFKRAGVGKLIGKRTWGGVVGDIPWHPLMDGGVVSAPSSHVWNPEGKYDIENQGVPPDIEVELDPVSVRQGHDPQLEKAIEVVMAELDKNPVPRPKRPPYPRYQRTNGTNNLNRK